MTSWYKCMMRVSNKELCIHFTLFSDHNTALNWTHFHHRTNPQSRAARADTLVCQHWETSLLIPYLLQWRSLWEKEVVVRLITTQRRKDFPHLNLSHNWEDNTMNYWKTKSPFFHQCVSFVPLKKVSKFKWYDFFVLDTHLLYASMVWYLCDVYHSIDNQ